jgi:hypothetical protein
VDEEIKRQILGEGLSGSEFKNSSENYVSQPPPGTISKNLILE